MASSTTQSRAHQRCGRSVVGMAVRWRLQNGVIFALILPMLACASQPKPVPQSQWSVERIMEWAGRPMAELSRAGFSRVRAPRRYVYLDPKVEPVRPDREGRLVAFDPDSGCYAENRPNGSYVVVASARVVQVPAEMECEINVMLACMEEAIVLACDDLVYSWHSAGQWTTLQRVASRAPYLLLALPSSVVIAYQAFGKYTWDDSIVAEYSPRVPGQPDLAHRQVLSVPILSWQRASGVTWTLATTHHSHLVRNLQLLRGSPFGRQDVVLELSASQMSAFHIDHVGRLWVGGLNQVRHTQAPVAGAHKLDNVEWVEVAHDLSLWDEALIRVIQPFADGTVWLGTEQNGVAVVQHDGVNRWIPTRTPETERIFYEE